MLGKERGTRYDARASVKNIVPQPPIRFVTGPSGVRDNIVYRTLRYVFTGNVSRTVYNVRAKRAAMAVINCRLLNDINNWDPGYIYTPR